MSFSGVSVNPGFFPKIDLAWNKMRVSLALSHPSMTTPAVRRKFNALPFEAQADLIAKYAKKQLASVDKLISGTKVSGTNAVDVWNGMTAYYTSLSDPEKITMLFHPLKSASPKIATIFSKMSYFWVANFYSCDAYGTSNSFFRSRSVALDFTPAQLRTIDEKSGLDRLGEHIKRYAEFLLLCPGEKAQTSFYWGEKLLDPFWDAV